MERRVAISACILVGVLVLSAPSSAQFYKWTDAAGTVHFSDSPPHRAAGGPAVEVVPEIQYRPPPTRIPTVVRDEPTPEEPVVEAPPAEERSNDAGSDYATEPNEEDGGSDTVVIDNTGDPAVWRRANSPHNRPGQPIRPAHRGR